MSTMSIAHYFPFCKVKITGQSVTKDAAMSWVEAEPDLRYRPVCYVCGSKAKKIHAWDKRGLRDLNFGPAQVWIGCSFRKIYCSACGGFSIEDLGFFEPYKRVTKRLARFIHELCKKLTVKDVAGHFGLDRKTVKNIDKTFLEEEFGETDYENLKILSVDEIALRKGHNYMTVVLDYRTGRVVWLGKGRKAETLMEFFDGMTDRQRENIEAVAMDMWNPYIKAVRAKLPNAKIVFDLFHVVSAFNKVIDKVRVSEYHKASEKDKTVYKGAKYLLLKNAGNIRTCEERKHLQKLLELNETLSTVMILKELLKEIWTYKYRGCAERAIDEWYNLARTIRHSDIARFARMLKRHRYGILNHCDYPIHTSKIEGVNNKIKLIKRKAYGFHDERYFVLKVIQAFDSNNEQLNGT